jgi:hypothetical protein
MRGGPACGSERQLELTTKLAATSTASCVPMVRTPSSSRRPARQASLLQEFERGLDAFEAMHGATESWIRLHAERLAMASFQRARTRSSFDHGGAR